MRRILSCLIMVCSISILVHAQDSGWVPQRSNTTAWLHGINFVSKHSGWVVGEDGTILKSTDEGYSWSAQSSGSTEPLESVDFIDSLHGWAVGGCSGCSDGVILKTTDGGNQWVTKDIGHVLNAVQFTSPNNGWTVGCDGLILQTTDAGETWNQVIVADLFSCLETVYFVDDSTGWIGGFIPGVLLKTTDAGGTWVSLTDSIDPQQDIDGMFFHDRQIGWLVGFGFTDTSSEGIIKKTTDGGATWTSEVSGLTDVLLSVSFADSQSGWVVSSSGTILRTVDGGGHWFSEPSNSTSGLERIDVRGGEGAWAIGPNGTILRKNLGGLTPQATIQVFAEWNLVSLPVVVQDGKSSSIFPDAASNLFYFSPGNGYVVASQAQTGVGYWLKMLNDEKITLSGSPIDSLTIHPVKGWNLIGGITGDIPLNNIIQDPPNSINAIFGYDGNAYVPVTTVKHGSGYWINCKDNCVVTIYKTVPIGIPRAMRTDPLQMHNDELPPPAPGEQPVSLSRGTAPKLFAVYQNYPNPFNPTTSIKFDLPEQSVVRLSVSNILGQEVAVLVNGVVEAGFRNVEWNSNSASGVALSSGIYIYRMQATSLTSGKEFFQTNKMILMK